MSRIVLFSLIAIVLLPTLAMAESQPTKQQTIEYILKKVGGPNEIRIAREFEGHGVQLEARTLEVFFDRKASKGDSKEVADFINTRTTSTLSGALAQGGDTGIYYSSCQINLLDPSTVSISESKSIATHNGAEVTIYNVTAETTNGETVAVKSGGAKGSKFVSVTEDSVLSVTVIEEKSAQVLKKSLEHLIRECGGKVSTKKPEPKVAPEPEKPDPTEAFFESDVVTSSKPAIKSTTLKEPTAPASPNTKPTNDLPRRTASKEIEKQIIAAEAQLPIAIRNDSDNQEWNNSNKAKLQKQLVELKAEAAEASNNGAKLKFTIAAAAVLSTSTELTNEASWRKKTDAADRLRERIADLKNTLVDLRD